MTGKRGDVVREDAVAALPADARLRASIITRSSIRLSFTGVEVGWTTKQFTPRMFSWIST